MFEARPFMVERWERIGLWRKKKMESFFFTNWIGILCFVLLMKKYMFALTWRVNNLFSAMEVAKWEKWEYKVYERMYWC